MGHTYAPAGRMDSVSASRLPVLWPEFVVGKARPVIQCNRDIATAPRHGYDAVHDTCYRQINTARPVVFGERREAPITRKLQDQARCNEPFSRVVEPQRDAQAVGGCAGRCRIDSHGGPAPDAVRLRGAGRIEPGDVGRRDCEVVQTARGHRTQHVPKPLQDASGVVGLERVAVERRALPLCPAIHDPLGRFGPGCRPEAGTRRATSNIVRYVKRL